MAIHIGDVEIEFDLSGAVTASTTKPGAPRSAPSPAAEPHGDGRGDCVQLPPRASHRSVTSLAKPLPGRCLCARATPPEFSSGIRLTCFCPYPPIATASQRGPVLAILVHS